MDIFYTDREKLAQILAAIALESAIALERLRTKELGDGIPGNDISVSFCFPKKERHTTVSLAADYMKSRWYKTLKTSLLAVGQRIDINFTIKQSLSAGKFLTIFEDKTVSLNEDADCFMLVTVSVIEEE